MKIFEPSFSVDLLRAILWQYNDATKLQALISSLNEWSKKNQTEFWSNWFHDVFNIDTANNFGLSVWSIILGISKDINIATGEKRKVFGFGANNLNFISGSNFAQTNGATPISASNYRRLLKARLLRLNCDGTITNINRIMAVVFTDNKVTCTDGKNMSIRYVFSTLPTSEELFILKNCDILIAPTGVDYSITAGTKNNWGFGKHHMNFFKGNFFLYKG